MSEVTFGVGYSNAGPQASPLYSDKMKTWIVATIPQAMFDSAKGKFTDIFDDIMTNLGYARHSPTLFSKGQSNNSSTVVEFDVREEAKKINIMLYRPKENVDAATETTIKNQLKEKIESAAGSTGDPENVDGGRKRKRKTRKSKRFRSRKHKKTRKH